MLSGKKRQSGTAAHDSGSQPVQSGEPRRRRHVALVSGFPVAADFRRPADYRRRRARGPPRAGAGVEGLPAAISRTARDRRHACWSERSLLVVGVLAGEETELELQRPGQRLFVRAVLGGIARFSSPDQARCRDYARISRRHRLRSARSRRTRGGSAAGAARSGARAPLRRHRQRRACLSGTRWRAPRCWTRSSAS